MRERAKAWTVTVKGTDGEEYEFKVEVDGCSLCIIRRDEELTLPLDRSVVESLYHDLMGIIDEVEKEGQ